ncbi:MAG: M20 family metallopeptidase [Planctomycetes bacterium]|jgi:succinyl-diaminopimelate desuccinylase|nr:M20 family metallopeptidase [Planctomycetota bacterium]
MNDVTELLTELIQADSTPARGEAAAADVLARRFRRHGVECRVDHWDDNRANIIAHVKSAGVRPALLFVCHLDVVGAGDEPWTHPPFGAGEHNGRIYGRGAVDMKGPTAAAVAAICRTVDAQTPLAGDILFAATAGEETDSAGVLRFMQDYFGGQTTDDRRHRADDRSRRTQDNAILRPLPSVLRNLAGIVIPEPTGLAVVTAHRGLFWLRITTRGKAVHSSMAERGVNAIGSMKRVIDELERYRIEYPPHPQLGRATLSINTIAGGEAMNIVPERCTLGVDIRTLPGQDPETIRYDFERILAQLTARVPQFEAGLTVERRAGAMETDPACDFVQAFCAAVGVDLTNAIGFTTDAPHLAPLGAPIVIYGPGNPKLCHEVDEHIEIADLQHGAGLFQNVIRRVLA